MSLCRTHEDVTRQLLPLAFCHCHVHTACRRILKFYPCITLFTNGMKGLVEADAGYLSRGAWSRFLLPGDLELSMEAQDVLCRVFRPDPKKRIALAELRKHPWLTRDTSAKPAQGMPSSDMHLV